MSDVTFQHPEYVKNLPYWQKMDDVCEGEDAVKAKGEQGIPLALDISSISAYCDHYELPVDRDIFNDCIFAMDNIFLDDSHKKMKHPTKK